MPRRAKTDPDASQLGLFAEPLPLAVRPAKAETLTVTRATVGAGATASTVKAMADPGGPTRKRLADLPPDILRPPAAARALSVSESLLKKWRLAGEGPRVVRLGARAIGYRCADLAEWVDGRVS
jgi:predicted DNA-binding transcriptional regulator AlpA